MDLFVGKPTSEEIARWFSTAPDAPAQTFEIALVLGGTVSAGGYTAGALDFLIEALDNWTEQKSRDPTAPQHNVVLRVITGTSGGGVNAAIMARALNFDFQPVGQATRLSSGKSGNPFYDVWVNTLHLDGFLDTSDLKTGFGSVLNGGPIDKGTSDIIAFTGRGVKQRAWIGTPLRTILTLTNIHGIPFKLEFDNDRSETYVDHADYIRYAIDYAGQQGAEYRPDELTLGFNGSAAPQASNWNDFGQFACATAAFPIGFPARELSRPTDHYCYRVVARPDENGQKTAFRLMPDWPTLIASGDANIRQKYGFVAVDGGTTDNEPIELGRTALCGLLGNNPRSPDQANRAVVLIDPFAGEATLGPSKIGAFTATAGGVLNSLLDQTRYDTSDLQLAANPNVYSRFMITPVRGNAVGSSAIASAGLSAFIGFASPDFMRYDYLLGRKNCQDFLSKTFVLSEKNAKVFDKPWTAAQKEKYAKEAPEGMQPIIPLVGSAAFPQNLDPWPAGKLDPETYRGAIEERFSAIANQVVPTIWGRLGGWSLKSSAADFVIKAMKAYLESARL